MRVPVATPLVCRKLEDLKEKLLRRRLRWDMTEMYKIMRGMDMAHGKNPFQLVEGSMTWAIDLRFRFTTPLRNCKPQPDEKLTRQELVRSGMLDGWLVIHN
eukprot:g35989.t1